MLSPNSPFLNIPAILDKKQAVFFDGMRQSIQIIELSYTRLCQSLTAIAYNRSEDLNPNFTHIFLDAWAFVDSVDRFRLLWQLQPSADTLPLDYTPQLLNNNLKAVRDIRNVAAHLAQKIDRVLSTNSSVAGSISWVTLTCKEPLKINTYFIRLGIFATKIKECFSLPSGETSFTYDSGNVILSAGGHEANLSTTYIFINSIVTFAEQYLESAFLKPEFETRLGIDIFGSAVLDI